MKKATKPLLFSLILLGSVVFSQISFAQAPPPPPSGSDKGGNTNKNPSGGGAPIDGGVIVALAMVAGFTGWKLLKAVKEKGKATIS